MRQARSFRCRQSRAGARSRARLAILTVASIGLSFVAVMFTAGTASADAAYCIRDGQASGPCVAKVGFPPNFPDTRAHGFMLIIGSGGWKSGDPNNAGDLYRKAFDRWVARGYIVAMVEHSDGTDALANTPTGDYAYINVLQWYDNYRAYWDVQPGYGANFPICATGFSSGGHLALMLGATRATLDCIVVEGAPSRIDYSAGNTRAPGLDPYVQDLADRTFSGTHGVSPQRTWSPLYQQNSMGQINMPILMGHANNDPLVSSDQTHTFCPRTSDNCRSEYLRAGGTGPVDFTHADVNNQDLLDFRAKERSWVCAIVSRITGPCS